ncbi:MAG: AsmA family protein, partial [Gammaproteobacteria bacterium]|nr:AsmA family protein [Gammaproteobacteria bacterium]
MKKFAILLVSLVIIVPAVFIGALMLLLSKPEYYQEQLQQQFRDSTGLTLELRQINWQYWPPIALQIGDVRIQNPETREEVATLVSAAVDLDIISLLLGEEGLQIKGFLVEGLRLNLIVDSYGNRNWINQEHDKTPTSTPPSTETEEDGVLALLPFGVRQLVISESEIHYEDRSVHQNLIFKVRDFSTDAVSYDQPFALFFDLNLRDENERADIDLAGSIGFLIHSTNQNIEIQDIRINGSLDLDGLASLPVGMNGNAHIDIGKDQLVAENLQLQLDDMVTDLNLTVEDIIKAPSGMNGSINVHPFNPKRLLKNLGLANLAFQKPSAFEKLALTMTMKTDFTRFETKDLNMVLDDTRIKGTLRPSFLKRPLINLNVDVDKINLSDYSTPDQASSEASATPTSGSEDSELIPRGLINAYTINAHFYISQLTMADIVASDLKMHLSTAANRMETTAEGKLYGGTFEMKFADNPDDLETSGYNRLSMNNVDVTGLTGFDWITGSLNLTSHIEFSGAEYNEIINSLNGPSSFRINDGTLDVTPVKSVAAIVDGLREQPSGIAQWPDKVSFQELEGHHRFSHGQKNQLFDMVVDNLRIDGRGDFNLPENTMDYSIAAMIRQSNHGIFKVSPEFSDISWPIRCKGSMDESPLRICKPDSSEIKNMVRNMAKQKVTDSAREKIKEKTQKAL